MLIATDGDGDNGAEDSSSSFEFDVTADDIYDLTFFWKKQEPFHLPQVDLQFNVSGWISSYHDAKILTTSKFMFLQV